MRAILHSDINNCYAGIEEIFHPELKGVPFVVGGDEEHRHGIVLAKNYPAKAFGIKTGEALFTARNKCPGLVVVPARMGVYSQYCCAVREIYRDYTDMVEPFGMDECWLDVTGSLMLFGSAEKIANEIRERVKQEIGVTVSVGVSFNKIFAKLGSDYKKPDAVTVISKENFKEIVWPLDCGELLYVGRRTREKLRSRAIFTIGDLANAEPEKLKRFLGKQGEVLYIYANGLDESPVHNFDYRREIKSVGASTTTPRDLYTLDDVRAVVFSLAEEVGERLREKGLEGNLVSIYVRDKELNVSERQRILDRHTNLASEIAVGAMYLFSEKYDLSTPLRSIGVRIANVKPERDENIQLSFFCDELLREKKRTIEYTVDKIKHRYGETAVIRAVTMNPLCRNGRNITALGFYGTEKGSQNASNVLQ